MKIAIISDIHGNLIALKSLLTKIEDCDKIYCLGDLAMAGPQPNKTINFIKTQNWSVIQGNTDEMIANFSDDIFEKVRISAPIMANALKADVLEISAENIDYLNNLPKQLQIDDFLFVHGSPRRNNEDIMPNLPMKQIEEIVDGVDANFIFCGHTHIPCGYQTNTRKTIVNVGSVGRPFTQKPQICYVIVDFNNGITNITHNFIEYDNKKSAEILKQREFIGADKLSEMLINPELRHM